VTTVGRIAPITGARLAIGAFSSTKKVDSPRLPQKACYGRLRRLLGTVKHGHYCRSRFRRMAVAAGKVRVKATTGRVTDLNVNMTYRIVHKSCQLPEGIWKIEMKLGGNGNGNGSQVKARQKQLHRR
jgi:hypothetical protein